MNVPTVPCVIAYRGNRTESLGGGLPADIMTTEKQRRLIDLLIILGLLLLVAGIVGFVMEGYAVTLICLPAAILLFVAVDWSKQ
jgi:hypothetical protein